MTDHPFTDEDRARLDDLDCVLTEDDPLDGDAASVRRALAHIDRLEGALRRIRDEDNYTGPGVPFRAIARAALDPAPTEQEKA